MIGRATIGAVTLIFAVVLLFGAAADGGTSVYTWTDKDGTVHFSQSGPPAGTTGVKEKVMRDHPRRVVRPASDEIQFVYRNGNTSQRFVPVTLEGTRARKEVLMLVDTGAQITLIDEDLAAALNVEHVQDARIVGATGNSSGWVGQLRSIRVGDDEIRDHRIMVGPQPGMRLLGMDVLGALQLTVGQKALHKER